MSSVREVNQQVQPQGQQEEVLQVQHQRSREEQQSDFLLALSDVHTVLRLYENFWQGPSESAFKPLAHIVHAYIGTIVDVFDESELQRIANLHTFPIWYSRIPGHRGGVLYAEYRLHRRRWQERTTPESQNGSPAQIEADEEQLKISLRHQRDWVERGVVTNLPAAMSVRQTVGPRHPRTRTVANVSDDGSQPVLGAKSWRILPNTNAEQRRLLVLLVDAKKQVLNLLPPALLGIREYNNDNNNNVILTDLHEIFCIQLMETVEWHKLELLAKLVALYHDFGWPLLCRGLSSVEERHYPCSDQACLMPHCRFHQQQERFSGFVPLPWHNLDVADPHLSGWACPHSPREHEQYRASCPSCRERFLYLRDARL